MPKTRKYVVYVIFFLLLGFGGLNSCSKMDDYKSFLEGKTFNYAGRPDTVIAFSGDNRILLSMIFDSDPNIDSVLVYWRSKSDSTFFPVTRSSLRDTVMHSIHLTEGDYSFELYAINNEGVRSAPTFVTGKVYGDVYRNSLLSTGIVSSEIIDNQLVIEWGNPNEGAIGTKLEYTDDNEESQTIIIPNDENESFIDDFKIGSDFSIQTMYLPDTLTVDTFYAAKETFKPDLPVYKLDKDLFEGIHLPSDNPYDQDPWYHQQKWAWDGYYNTDPTDFESTSHNTGHKYQSALTGNSPRGTNPSWITFTLGTEVHLTKFVLHTYFPFLHSTPKRYEIWGSLEKIDDFEDPSWVKLGESENLTASGDPNGSAEKQEDIDAWVAGDTVELDDGPKVKYIRFKLLENYKSTTQIQIAELDVFGHD